MIKTRTTYDGKYKWAMHKFKKPVDVNVVIFTVLNILWICVLTFYAFVLVKYIDLHRRSFIYFLGADVIMTAFLIRRFVRLYKNTKKMLSEAPEEKVIDFTFDDRHITQEYSSRDESGSFSISYDSIFSAAETKEYFIFSVDTKNAVFSIAKSDIIEGTAEELSALLSEKAGKRFRRRCK